MKCLRFLVLLREDIPDCVDAIRERTACYERYPDNVNFLIEVNWHNIAVSDGDHGYDGEIQCRNVSDAPFFVFKTLLMDPGTIIRGRSQVWHNGCASS